MIGISRRTRYRRRSSKAWDQMRQGQRLAHPTAWVIRVAMNETRSIARRVSAELKAWRNVDMSETVPETASSSAVHAELMSAFRGMPIQQRRVATLYYLLDMSARRSRRR